MTRIKILITPASFAPRHIRRDWVGIVLPLATEEELSSNPVSVMALRKQNVGQFIVLLSKAVYALRQAGRDTAADYWEAQIKGEYIVFHEKVCERV